MLNRNRLIAAFFTIALLASFARPGSSVFASGNTLFVAVGGSNTGANTCLSSGSPCATIAYAITQALAGDTIAIATGTYTENAVTVDRNLTISGAGAGSSIVQASGNQATVTDSVFIINGGVTASLSGLTIRFGHGSDGGGIRNLGSLTVSNSTVANNTSSNAGGGIKNSGSLTISNSTVSSNIGFTGGAIDSSGSTLVVNNSTLSGNSSDYGGGLYLSAGATTLNNSTLSGNFIITSSGGSGGGIQNGSTLILNSSTISGNTSDSYGGGIANSGASANLTINNSTISGNTASGTGGGGGIENIGNSTLNLNYSTIANNSAPNGSGGGLYNYGASTTANIKSSILAGNSAGGSFSGADADCYRLSGTATSLGYNLTGSGTSNGCTFSATGDTTVAPATVYTSVLGALANNGGPTQTHALLAGSPAIDQIPNGTNTCGSAPFNADQRGVARPYGTTCDMGAFEWTQYTISGNTGVAGATLSYTDGTPKNAIADGSGNYSFTVSYNWSGTVTPSKTDVSFSPASRPYSNVTANQTGQNYTGTLTISGRTSASGATLSYTDGTPKTTIADGSGNYSFEVSYNWSGTVTPSVAGITFTPASRVYTNITLDQASQDYSAILNVKSAAAQDGWILESSELSNTGGSLNANATTFQLGDDALNRQYRAILSFNTAALPDNATITSALLKIKQSGAPHGSNPFSALGSLWADIRQGSFGTTVLQLADFNSAASATKVGAFNKTPVSGSYTDTLILAGRNKINKLGLTQLRLYFSKDDNNNHIADFMQFVSGNSPGNKPYLLITYTLP